MKKENKVKKTKKVKEPLLPEQKRVMKYIAALIAFLVALGLTLSVLSWQDLI